MSESASPLEKIRSIGTAPLRWMGRQAVEHLSLGILTRNNRYDTHLRELRRVLSSIPTHHAEHHLLRRFVSDLPRTFTQPWSEHGQVAVIDTLDVHSSARHDNIKLITEGLLGTRLTDADLVAQARSAEQVPSSRVDEVCQLAVTNQNDYAWVLPATHEYHRTKIEEYVTPTIINGLVVGFSGPAIRGTDSPSSEFTIKFYSVPPEQ